MDLDDIRLFRECIKKWGTYSQIMMAIEELSELTTVLCHSLRRNKPYILDDLIEEMADVKLMLDQVQLIFTISDIKLETARNNKIIRLQKMLSKRVI